LRFNDDRKMETPPRPGTRIPDDFAKYCVGCGVGVSDYEMIPKQRTSVPFCDKSELFLLG
jgi:hypothetical protein